MNVPTGDRGVRDFEGARAETSYWPLLLIELPKGRVPDAALHGLLGHLETLMREAVRVREKIFIITDLTRMEAIPPASQRKYTGEWIKRTEALTVAAAVASAQVTPSAILRGIITAVFWIHPPPTPTVFVATRREAITRGIETLEAAKELFPSRVRELREALRRGGVL